MWFFKSVVSAGIISAFFVCYLNLAPAEAQSLFGEGGDQTSSPQTARSREEAYRALYGSQVQGDVLFDKTKNAISHEELKWPRNEMAYVIDNSLYYQAPMIHRAAQLINAATGNCVRLVPRTTQPHYVGIFSGRGCYSYIGYQGVGMQPLSLGNGCQYIGTIIHEFLHALGFHHEHNRSDRDNYLIIFPQNIEQGMETQFRRLNPQQHVLFNNFDYQSIMMYGEYAFSKDQITKTMVDRYGRYTLKEPFDKAGMTESDVHRLKMLYNCY